MIGTDCRFGRRHCRFRGDTRSHPGWSRCWTRRCGRGFRRRRCCSCCFCCSCRCRCFFLFLFGSLGCCCIPLSLCIGSPFGYLCCFLSGFGSLGIHLSESLFADTLDRCFGSGSRLLFPCRCGRSSSRCWWLRLGLYRRLNRHSSGPLWLVITRSNNLAPTICRFLGKVRIASEFVGKSFFLAAVNSAIALITQFAQITTLQWLSLVRFGE